MYRCSYRPTDINAGGTKILDERSAQIPISHATYRKRAQSRYRKSSRRAWEKVLDDASRLIGYRCMCKRREVPKHRRKLSITSDLRLHMVIGLSFCQRAQTTKEPCSTTTSLYLLAQYSASVPVFPNPIDELRLLQNLTFRYVWPNDECRCIAGNNNARDTQTGPVYCAWKVTDNGASPDGMFTGYLRSTSMARAHQAWPTAHLEAKQFIGWLFPCETHDIGA